MDEPDLESLWGLVANVVDERFYGPEGVRRSGTKHFVPGAKVFYHLGHWGMGADQVTVTGQHRGSKRLVTVVMARRHLHNWRAQLIYKPSVLRKLTSSWYEIVDSPRSEDPEIAARELAHDFNNARHFSTYDRPKGVVDRLISTWQLAGYEGLDRVEGFSADRWVILYEHLTPVGVGVSDFTRECEWWIQPGYEKGSTKLKATLKWSLPDGTDSPRLEYETGLSSETLRELSELMSAQFEYLHTAIFDTSPTAPDVDYLARFVEPLLRSSLVNWPHALSDLETEVLAGWLGGRSEADLADGLDTSEAQISVAFELLRTTCFHLAGAALRLMKEGRDYDADEKDSISKVLGRNRLQSGVNSALADSLVQRRYRQHFGFVSFGRVAASALATQFRDRPGSGERELFIEFALDRVQDWVNRGLLQSLDLSGEAGGWGTVSNQLDGQLVAYRIDVSPE